MNKQIGNVVECEILQAMNTLCDLLQTGDITSGETYNLVDMVRMGMWTRWREATAEKVAE